MERVARLPFWPVSECEEDLGAIASYEYLLINVKLAAKNILPSVLMERLDELPTDFQSMEQVRYSRAYLDALAFDIREELENPTIDAATGGSAQLLISLTLIKQLSAIGACQFDLTILCGYCKEINSSFYHGNVVACMLLMRTVLNHVPPVFGLCYF
jgi:hypothetical protein